MTCFNCSDPDGGSGSSYHDADEQPEEKIEKEWPAGHFPATSVGEIGLVQTRDTISSTFRIVRDWRTAMQRMAHHYIERHLMNDDGAGELTIHSVTVPSHIQLNCTECVHHCWTLKYEISPTAKDNNAASGVHLVLGLYGINVFRRHLAHFVEKVRQQIPKIVSDVEKQEGQQGKYHIHVMLAVHLDDEIDSVMEEYERQDAGEQWRQQVLTTYCCTGETQGSERDKCNKRVDNEKCQSRRKQDMMHRAGALLSSIRIKYRREDLYYPTLLRDTEEGYLVLEWSAACKSRDSSASGGNPQFGPEANGLAQELDEAATKGEAGEWESRWKQLSELLIKGLGEEAPKQEEGKCVERKVGQLYEKVEDREALREGYEKAFNDECGPTPEWVAVRLGIVLYRSLCRVAEKGHRHMIDPLLALLKNLPHPGMVVHIAQAIENIEHRDQSNVEDKDAPDTPLGWASQNGNSDVVVKITTFAKHYVGSMDKADSRSGMLKALGLKDEFPLVGSEAVDLEHLAQKLDDAASKGEGDEWESRWKQFSERLVERLGDKVPKHKEGKCVERKVGQLYEKVEDREALREGYEKAFNDECGPTPEWVAVRLGIVLYRSLCRVAEKGHRHMIDPLLALLKNLPHPGMVVHIAQAIENIEHRDQSSVEEKDAPDTPLGWASQSDNSDVVEKITTFAGHYVRSKDKTDSRIGMLKALGFVDECPLRIAAKHGHVEITMHLLNAMQLLLTNKSDSYGVISNALENAVDSSQFEVAVLLWKSLPDPYQGLFRSENRFRCEKLLTFAVQSGHTEAVPGLWPSAEARETATRHLGLAARNGHLELVRWLVEEKNANIWALHGGFSLLYNAARGGHLEIVRWLVDEQRAAPVLWGSDKGLPPLQGAAEGGHLDVMQYLHRQGACVGDTHPRGLSALHCAAARGQMHVVKWLVEQNWVHLTARSNAPDYSGNRITPLCMAAKGDHCSVVEFLTHKLRTSGVGESQIRCDRLNALKVAAGRGHQRTVKEIIEAEVKNCIGAPCQDALDNAIMKALKAAAKSGHKDILHTLIEKLSLAKCNDKEEARVDVYISILEWASERAHLNIVSWVTKELKKLRKSVRNRRGDELFGKIQKGWRGASSRAVEGQAASVLNYLIEESSCYGKVGNEDVEEILAEAKWNEGHLRTYLEYLAMELEKVNPENRIESDDGSSSNPCTDKSTAQLDWLRKKALHKAVSEIANPVPKKMRESFKKWFVEGLNTFLNNSLGTQNWNTQEGDLLRHPCVLTFLIRHLPRWTLLPKPGAEVVEKYSDKLALALQDAAHGRHRDGMHPDVIWYLMLCIDELTTECQVKYVKSVMLGAALGGHDTGVEKLLERCRTRRSECEGDAWTECQWGAIIKTSLEGAAWGGHLKTTERLLRETKELDGCQHAAIMAAFNGRTDIVQALVAGINTTHSGGHDNCKSPENRRNIVNLLLYAASMRGNAELVRWLCSDPEITVNVCGGEERQLDVPYLTPLHGAVLSGDIEMIEWLLRFRKGSACGKGLNLVESRSSGSTHEVSPLYGAAYIGYSAIVHRLVLAGHAIDWKSRSGFTALYVASIRGWQSSVNILAPRTAEFDQPVGDKNFKETPLSAAARNGHAGVVQCLVDLGANVNAQNSRGNTPVHEASRKGHWNIVVSLVQGYGAHVDSVNHNGLTPLHYAALNDHLDVVEWLVNQGASVRAKDSEGKTPLDCARSDGVKDTLKRSILLT